MSTQEQNGINETETLMSFVASRGQLPIGAHDCTTPSSLHNRCNEQSLTVLRIMSTYSYVCISDGIVELDERTDHLNLNLS